LILAPPVSVQKLQTALQAKAKGAPDYRFYLLYGKLYRKRCSDLRLSTVQSQQGGTGDRQSGLRGHRGVRGRALARRTGGHTPQEDVSS
jgi:hypothetical protein